MMTELAQDDLNRLVDGRHSPALQEALSQRVQREDPALAAQIEAWRRQSEALRTALNDLADLPASPWLALYTPPASAYRKILAFLAILLVFGLGIAAGLVGRWALNF